MALPIKGLWQEVTGQCHAQYPTVDGRRQPCMDMELNTMECFEAYGMSKGTQMCQKYLEDLGECKFAKLRMMRANIMRQERFKKVMTGKLPFEQRKGRPYNYDSFVHGVFFP